MEQKDKRLIDITLDELDSFLKERGYLKREPSKDENADVIRLSDYSLDQLLRGDHELADYLGISVTAIYGMKKSGRLDGTYANPTPRRYIYIKPLIDRMIFLRDGAGNQPQGRVRREA